MSGTSSNALQAKRFGSKVTRGWHELMMDLEERDGVVQDGPRDLMIVGFTVKCPEGPGEWSKVVWKATDEFGARFVAFSEGRTTSEALGSGIGAMLAGRIRWNADKPWDGGSR